MSLRSARNTNVAGIVLAAGEGKRIGGNKALLEVEGVKSLDRVAACMLSAGCDPVIVVGGAEGRSVKEEALRLGIRFVLNRNWQNGQFSSVKVGLGELTSVEVLEPDADADGPAPAARRRTKMARENRPAPTRGEGAEPGADGPAPANRRGAKMAGGKGAATRTAGAMVALVDHPYVRKETYQVLVRTFQRSPERIIIPTHHDRRGHPVVVPREVITKIIGAPDGSTLRDIIRKHDNLVLEQAVDDAGILKDIDTHTDLNSER